MATQNGTVTRNPAKSQALTPQVESRPREELARVQHGIELACAMMCEIRELGLDQCALNGQYRKERRPEQSLVYRNVVGAYFQRLRAIDDPATERGFTATINDLIAGVLDGGVVPGYPEIYRKLPVTTVEELLIEQGSFKPDKGDDTSR